MKRLFCTLCTVACLTLAFTGCGTTSVVENPAPETEKPKAPETKEKHPKNEEKEPANIKFASQLQQLLEKNDTKGAIALFSKIPSELKKDLELKMLLAALYYSDSQFDNAIATANEVLEVEPRNSDALELIMLCNRASGDKKSYQESANKILAADPYNAAVNIQKAEDYAISKKYKLARDSYRKALVGNPKNSDAMFGYAQMSYYMGDLEASQAYFQKILDENPQDAAALAYMGKLAGDNENYLRATKYIQEAIKYDPKNYDYWMDYGTYLRYQGKFEDAANAWKKAADIDPSFFLAYAYLAGNYDDLGKYDLALEYYHKVIETNPKYYFAYEETAILEYHAGNYKNAIKYFSEAYKYSADYCYSLMIAACYFKLKDSVTAKKVLGAELKKQKNDSIEYNMLRFWFDSYSKNAESSLVMKISKEDNSNKRGKMLFYMGLYCENSKAYEMANEYYAKVTAMQAPMFFEYRIAEWSLKK